MAMNIYIGTVDTKGTLQSSSTPSAGDDLVNKTYVDAVVTVTVSDGKFVLDGVSQATANFVKSGRIVFDLSAVSTSHPFRLSTTSNGTHTTGGQIYTGASDADGTTKVSNVGTQGSAGAALVYTPSQASPDLLYYFCTAHPGMGGALQGGAIGESISQSGGKVGIDSTSPSHKLDVNGDIRVRGNNIRDNSGNSAITFDGSANTQIDGTLTVASGKTVSINGVTYTFPSSDGSSGQFLKTNGSGTLSFGTASGGGGGIASVSADSDPTLGGNLKVGGYSIVSTSNGNIPITPDGSGTIVLDGLVWPTADGSADQVLKTNGSGVLSWVDQSGGGGGSGFSVTSAYQDITLGAFQTAYDAASAKGWSISPSGLTVPSGKTLLGVNFQVYNTLGRESYGSWSAVYDACAIGFDDPSGSTAMPVFIGGAWNAGSNWSSSSPYLSASAGPYPGWYWRDSSYTNQYITNDGSTTTNPQSAIGSCGIKFSSNTQIKIYYFEMPSSNNDYSISTGSTTSSHVLHRLTIYYA